MKGGLGISFFSDPILMKNHMYRTICLNRVKSLLRGPRLTNRTGTAGLYSFLCFRACDHLR